MKFLASALLAVALAYGGVAAPEEIPTQGAQSSTVHRHLGFFARADLGASFTSASETHQGASQGLQGWGAGFGFSIGGALSEDNILALYIFLSTTGNVNYSSPTSSSGKSGVPFSLTGLGPEYTHYFMPLNLYLSVSLLLTKAEVSNGQWQLCNGAWEPIDLLTCMAQYTQTTSISSDIGGGPNVAIGKEWWVADHWGIGLTLRYQASWNHDSGGILGSSTLFTGIVALVFSATYN